MSIYRMYCAAAAGASILASTAFGATLAAGHDHHKAETVSLTERQAGDIIDTAVEAGNFTILARALAEAGLVEALKGEGPFTVFAPTDEAFAKLGNDTIENLLKPENRAQLTRILTYHVIEGAVRARDVIGGAEAPTLAGDQLSVGFGEGRFRVNNSNIVAIDIEASNGVIHVIDTVLLPPEPQGRKIIGIYDRGVHSDQRDALRLDSGEGIAIDSVTRGGGAEAAGLKKGDVILSINGRPATSRVLTDEKNATRVGDTITVTFARTVEVKIGVDED